MGHAVNLFTDAPQDWRIPVLLALAVGDLAEQMVPEATFKTLIVHHKPEGLALIWPQLDCQTLCSNTSHGFPT